MKHIITLILMVFSLSCFSQTPNPDLFRTWYLYDYYSTDDNIHHPVQAISPPISPFITFTDGEALTHNGKGACNFFTGDVSNPFGDVLVFSNFSPTLSLCGAQAHAEFEGAYFSLFYGGGQYFINGTGNNMTLIITTPIFMSYVFGNTPLSSSDFELKQTLIYPNPVESKLFIDSQNKVIDKIEIFNSLGQAVKTINTDFNEINVSELASGIYLMKLYSEGSMESKKFIKN